MDLEKSVVVTVKTLSNHLLRYMTGTKNTLAKEFQEFKSITEEQGRILAFLYDHKDSGPIYQKDLEKQFTIRRSTATVILQRMEKAGILTREVSSEDARMKTIALTEEAKRMHPVVYREIMKAEEQATRGLTREEVQTFLRIAQIIRKNVS